MLFSENIKLFNHSARTLQTNRQDWYDNTALCTIVHRAVKISLFIHFKASYGRPA